MEFNSSYNLQHPREKLPQPTISVLDTTSDVNFQCGCFFITTQEFETRLTLLLFIIGKLKYFVNFLKVILT